jgi:hypothetical protein
VALVALALGLTAASDRDALPPPPTPGVEAPAPPPPESPVAEGGALEDGARLAARLNRNVATARALGPDRIADVTAVGQPWAATLLDDVVDQRGRVRLAAGSVVHGTVRELSPAYGVARPAMALDVDRIGERSVSAHVAEPPFDAVVAGDAGSKVAGGAAGGAIVGGIAFGIPGIVLGYGLGGSAGASAAAGQRRVDAWLAAGSIVIIELDERLAL